MKKINLIKILNIITVLATVLLKILNIISFRFIWILIPEIAVSMFLLRVQTKSK
ncbi:hypothetical protein [Sarcina ventriculi]|uniref:hypothetical protein n=1 Tax=Sarcina ventriculi TaxID=1267 RepID=UPI0018A94DD2|nr:hypothetical protein [Sarcina ventriculi]